MSTAETILAIIYYPFLGMWIYVTILIILQRDTLFKQEKWKWKP